MNSPECVEKLKPVKGSADTKFRGKFPSRVFCNCDHRPIQKRYEVQAQKMCRSKVSYMLMEGVKENVYFTVSSSEIDFTQEKGQVSSSNF